MRSTPSPPAVPPAKLLDPAFVYHNHEHTDVQVTWMRFGWVPPSVKRKPVPARGPQW